MPEFGPEGQGFGAWLTLGTLALLGTFLGIAGMIWPGIARRRVVLFGGTVLILCLAITGLADLLAVVRGGSGPLHLVWQLTLIAVGCAAARYLPARLSPPQRFYWPLLLLLIGIGMSFWLSWRITAIAAANETPIEFVVGASDSWRAQEDRAAEARTDRGVAIKLLSYHEQESTALRLQGPDAAERLAALALYAWQVGPREPRYNCHGWTFTGGRYRIDGDQVERILLDNGYQPVAAPQPGDIIVYHDDESRLIVHTGIVKATGNDGYVLVESKWGTTGGRFLHEPANQPYASRYTYYRTNRPNHVLAGLPSDPNLSAAEKPSE